MNYEVFLFDGVSEIKLDAEEIEMITTFSVADIADISKRKDSITKNVLFKGTRNNNQAFGSLFHANKITDTSILNKIGFNYNPLRTVDCWVYENGMILFKGSMRVLEIDVTKNNEIIYQTCITGKFIDFKSTIADKQLSDLDFSDLRHDFYLKTISDSWSVQTQRFNTDTKTKYFTPFEKGSGYIYPFIDYGISFNPAASNATIFNSDVNKIQVTNFRPAIYVREYFDRIFKQEEISDFTYEIKGSDAFLKKFNSLIIPNADEKFTFVFNKNGEGYYQEFKNTTPETKDGAEYNLNEGFKLVSIPQASTEGTINISPLFGFYSTFDDVLTVNRTIKTDGNLECTVSGINNLNSWPGKLYAQIVVRDETNNQNSNNKWEEVAKTQAFDIAAKASNLSHTFSLTIPEKEYLEGQQLAIRMYWQVASIGITKNLSFSVDSTVLKFPKDESTVFTSDIKYNVTWTGNPHDADKVTPKPPEGIKQMDFLKSIIKLFNFYVYTRNDKPKHLIFEKYDDFYAPSDNNFILDSAINWTNKIDYSSGYKIKTNIQLPKNYSFTYKEDSDYLNELYKKTYNETYGTFHFTDAFGVTDEKKVEINFSPTPLLQYDGTRRLIPALYSGSKDDKKPSKTNIRILYYNGMMDCSDYTIARDRYESSGWICEDLKTFSQYPNTGSYYYENNIPVEDLNFGRPKTWWFAANADYINASTAYNEYYLNQTAELTNPNIYTIECSGYLNEIDINKLDLKIPVFIDLGDKGQAYFKILSVEYENNSTPAKLILQKVFLG